MSLTSGKQILLTAAGGVTAGRSVRFNSADSAYLSRTPASAGNRKTWTWSGWVKRCGTGNMSLVDAGTSTAFRLRFTSEQLDVASNTTIYRRTAAVLRDFSAWYHIVIVLDTTQATASNRVKVYINGQEITTFSTSNDPTLNEEFELNNNVAHTIGTLTSAAGNFFNGYLALVHFIDGQALTPSSFGETSATTGQWIAKTYGGTYGTNGFFLDFLDNSTAAALGYDAAGSNDWTVNNISVSNTVANYTSGLSFVGYAGSTTISDPASGFDNDINTRFVGDTASSGGQTATYTWVPPGGSISATSFKLRLQYFGVLSFATISVAVNGGSYYSTGGGDSITTYDFSSLITGNQITEVKLKWQSNSGGIGSPGWYALYVNDVLLADSSGSDSLRDHPTSAGTSTGLGGEVAGNYCTWNPLKTKNFTLSDGNLRALASNTTTNSVVGTIGVSSGKWYWEVVMVGGSDPLIGICKDGINLDNYPGGDANGWGYYSNGNKYTNSTAASYGASYTTNDVIGVALDMDAGTVTFYKNGTSQGQAYSGLTGPIFPAVGDGGNSVAPDMVANFGQRAFAYTAPSGFSPLVDTLLPTPTIAKPNTVMDVKLYTGNGSTQTISGLGFSPDFVWVKSRSSGRNHGLFNTVAGVNRGMHSNLTDAEFNDPSTLTAFNSDGFTLSTNITFNANTETFVAWTWDAGSSNATNTSGTITSTVRANISAGFSICSFTWSPTGNGTFGHGLGAVPEFAIFKIRNITDSWWVYHKSIGNTNYLNLNTTGASAASSQLWNNTTPTSSVMTLGANWAGDVIGYLWAPVAGYSAFGSYTGNGSSDGPFVYTGFRPRWVLIKMSSSTGSWYLIDTARLGYNADNNPLYPNLSVDEQTDDIADILSNGFKIRNSFAGVNTSSGTYVWAAFAEAPFPYARAR